jgi:saccharopine dehydrogenase-like NADP-dependent oxidoreductase
MKNALVLGAGMVGSVMAADFAGEPGWRVTIADRREEHLARAQARSARLGRKVDTLRADLSNPDEVRRLAGGADMVLGALSSAIGLSAMRAVIEAGRHYADISFMAEDPTNPALGLNELAKARGVTVVYDFGVAPGMSHLLAAHGARLLDRCDSLEIYVGGLPVERRWPFEYQAAFSPADVIEEYTRPSRLVEHGREVTREALSEPELMDFPGVGTLEAFNTDGLRSLCAWKDRVPFMKEKTLRYPGHIALMRALRHTGLFSQEPVTIPDEHGKPVRVRPLELISTLMFPQWTYQPGEADLTVMRVIAAGQHQGQARTHTWDLLDHYDPATQATSMARTTAFPCAILARAIAQGRYQCPGVNPPERVAEAPGLVQELLDQLAARGVKYAKS